VWVRSFAVVFCSLIASMIGAAAALANGTGGVTAAEPSPSNVTTTVPTVHAPVTAKSSKTTYKGPVYEKTTTGEIVAFTPPAPTNPAIGTAASSTTPAAPSTGGSAAVTTEPAGLPTTIPAELTIGEGMTGATGPTPRPELLVPGTTARFIDGLAAAPEGAPVAIQEIIWAGNELIGLPYIYGGGHGSFISPGYDCSGTVSFALHGANLLAAPEDSSEMEGFGARGDGRWVTLFANPGHAYMTVAGLRLDTSPAEDPANLQGPRWRPLRQTNAGFVVRHPVGL
jgi:cell wall-associated NlpC family hydrolase